MFGIYGEVSKSHGDIWLQLEIIARSIVLEVSKTHVEDRNKYGSPWLFLVQQDKKRMDVHCILIQPIWKTTRTVFSASLVCGLVLIEMCHLVRSCSTVSLFFVFFVMKLFWTGSIGKNLDDWRGKALPHPQRVIHQLPKLKNQSG